MEDESVVLWRTSFGGFGREGPAPGDWTESEETAKAEVAFWNSHFAHRMLAQSALQSRRFIPAPEPQEPADD